MAVGGAHFPRSERELRSWFIDDDACLDYLDWLRWGTQRVCPHCGVVLPQKPASGRQWRCPECTARVSRTAGTIFQDTRTPLTVWFAAGWEMCADKGGVSAMALKRRLSLGSYQTAWTMLHRYRAAMALAGQDLLTGDVEVDETLLGGTKAGPPGRGALGKVLLGVALETKQPKGFGRVRLRILPDASGPSLRAFLTDTVQPGAHVTTDGWKGYPPATRGLYTHTAHSIRASGLHAHVLLPGVHRVASLLKRWMLGTHQGSVGTDHLDAYLAEFTFRFNRRLSSERGLLFYRLMTYAAQADPITYTDLIQTSRPKKVNPTPPTGPRRPPRSLAITSAGSPWRQHTPVP